MAIFKKKKDFPTFAVIVFVAAVLWFLAELKVITVDIPWFPMVVGLIALGWIVKYYQK
ncbi:hypothetical protein ACFLZB_03655 [Nanoarchaeota archaeon]